MPDQPWRAVPSQCRFPWSAGCHESGVHFTQSSTVAPSPKVATRLGTRSERHAVQQADQPDALRRVMPLACASGPPRLARGLSATLDRRLERDCFLNTTELRASPNKAASVRSRLWSFRHRIAASHQHLRAVLIRGRPAAPRGPDSPRSSLGVVGARPTVACGALAMPIPLVRWLPRKRRTLHAVVDCRAVTEGGDAAWDSK